MRAVLFLMAAPAIAAGAPLSAAPEKPLEEIQVTATRQSVSSFDVAPAVTVITAEQLQRNAPLTIVDHLRGEPGTFVQQTTPGQGIVILRGLKGSEVLHLVDGFRLNTAIFRNAPNQYIALVDPWNLERIEVVRGAMGALYGGDAMGGVVQFLTRTPHFDQAETQSRFKVGVQTESANESLATYAEGEVGNERWLLQSGLTWQDVNEQRTGGGAELPYTSYGFRGLNTRLQFAPTPDDAIGVQVQLSEQPETPRHDALVPGFGQTQPDSAEHVFNPQQRHFAQARWRTERVSSIADSVALQVGYQRIVDNRITRDFGSMNRESEGNESALWGASAQLSIALSERHDLTYGLEGYHDTVTSTRTRSDLTSGTVTERPSRFPDGSTMGWVAAYAQDQLDLTKALQLTGGARYSAYRISLADTATDRGVDLEPDNLSWNVSALYRASDALHWVANVGHGFRPPNIFDLGTFGPRQNRFSIPNPDLEPETVTTYDLGFKYESVHGRAELSAFESRYANKITQVLTGATDPSGRLIVQSQNATELKLRGIEAGAFYTPLAALELYATATWTTGNEQLAGDTYPADRIPPLFGKLELRYAPPNTRTVDLGATLDWAAQQDRLSPRDQVDPRINPEGTDGWYTIGLYAHFQPADAWTLTLGAENLLDRRYREHGSGFDAPGRNFSLRAKWTH